MIEATVAMAVMAGLFVAFGVLRVADRASGDGDCGGCAGGSGCSRSPGCSGGPACAVHEGTGGEAASHRSGAPRDAGGIW